MFFKSNISNFSKASLVLENGDIFPCFGIGATGLVTGELCFNTAMTGYQEAISDPSYKLIREAISLGAKIESIPGASAVLAALVTSGLPTDRFIFEGFLPPKKGRKKRIENIADENATIVIYESKNRLQRTIKQILDIIGDRPAVICRELTKLHEECIRGTLSSLLSSTVKHNLKGEIVLLIGKNDKNVYFN